ncbi:ABC transporter permease, partial [Streptococcus thermophilus]|nr:ABC transporter permease [Streptococcus thermophilus]
TLWQMWDNPFVIIIPYILPVLVFGLGLWIFTKNSKKFAEVI